MTPGKQRTEAGIRYGLLLRWYRLGLIWTERQCRRHGGDYYSRNGYSWLLRKLGWD